jgi:hypothetical protein
MDRYLRRAIMLLLARILGLELRQTVEGRRVRLAQLRRPQ